MNVVPDMALLSDLRAAGLEVSPRGDGRVNVSPKSNLTPELRTRILDAKAALLAALDLDQRIRAMALRWGYSAEDLEDTLGAARENPAGWIGCVVADEQLADKLQRAGMPFLAGG